MARKSLPVRQIDAFTTLVGRGNAAGIIDLEEAIPDDTMRVLAREMNLSETAFLLPDPVGEADYRVRFWTPLVEVPLCGHATIASLHHLAERTGKPDIRLSTRVGVLAGTVRDGVAWTMMDATKVLGTWDGPWGDVAAVVDPAGTGEVIAPGAEPLATADGVLFIEVRDVATLDAMVADLGVLKALEQRGIRMLVVWTTKGTEPEVTWNLRVFAPAMGIAEDPVTGLANTRLANVLLSIGRLRGMPPERKASESEASGRAEPDDSRAPARDQGVVRGLDALDEGRGPRDGAPPWAGRHEAGDDHDAAVPDGGSWRWHRYRARQGEALDRAGDVDVAVAFDAGGQVAQTWIGGRAVVSLEGTIHLPPHH